MATPQLSHAHLETSSSGYVKCEYEVFLSFRGEDTRNNFVSHLYKELKRKGIHTFKDDKELKRGKSISPSLLEVIKKSKISIVVLSPNYPSSSWCLDELVEITKCIKTNQQIILPIFFNIDPSDIEEQTGILAKAFEVHERKFSDHKIRRWRDALSTIANISGWDSRKCFDGNEVGLIECIVRDILDKLICKVSSFGTYLVGIDSHIMSIEEKLDLKCNDVRMVGIWGTGGIGKTTIADFIYCRDFNKYEACCRLKNIKDKYKDGATALQKELISQILSERDIDIWDEDVGCDLICRRLCNKKVLIVLDDVDNLEQLKALADSDKWFGQGSRIIITTRDKRLLVLHGLKHIYKVQLLETNKEALQLFSLYAFKENQPLTDFLELSNKFVSYAKGLPLALKILGTSLYKRDKGFWQSELEKLKRVPHIDIYKILRISYDRLDDLVQAVFLDVAFFFHGKSKVTAENVLRGCGFCPERAFAILEEKALLTISQDNQLNMHDLIREMGYEVVRRESKEDPSRRSRLYHPKDVYDVLTHHKGSTTPIEGISLNTSKVEKQIYLKPNIFTGMNRLRILHFVEHWDNKIHLPEGLVFLPNELRYIRWDRFPAKTLPSITSFGKNLVELQLQCSKIEHILNGEAELWNLRVIDLSFSTHLKALPNLSKAPNIEEIKVKYCKTLNEFSSDLKHLQKLKILDLEGCEKLTKLPMLPPNLVKLYLSVCNISHLPSGIQLLKKLEVLTLNGCKKLKALPKEFGALKSLSFFIMSETAVKELPQSFGQLKSLATLELCGVAITGLPESFGEMKCLTSLELHGTPITELPVSIGELQSLKTLTLACMVLIELPQSIGQLKSLGSLELRQVAITELPLSIGELNSLKTLILEGVPILELPESMGHLEVLRRLELTECRKLTRLPSSMHELFSLNSISIKNCESLCFLPELPSSLETLVVQCCESLETIRCNDLDQLRGLNKLSLIDCYKLDRRTCSEIWENARMMLHSRKECRCHSVEYVVPGDEIPDWFDYTSCEESMTITLPSSSLYHIRGFAVSFVVQVCGDNPQVEYVVLSYSAEDDPLKRHLIANLDDDPQYTHICCKVYLNLFIPKPSDDLEVTRWGIYLISKEEAI